MTIKLDYFDYDLISNYRTKNLLENDFWLFGSFSNTTSKPISTNAEKIAKDFLKDTVFGVKIEEEDTSFMIKNIPWSQGIVFSAFDDDSEIFDKNFYTIIEPELETGDYAIFKCIENNYNSVSTVKPIYNSSFENGIHALSDGYVWKYMGKIPYTNYKKFAASGYVPINNDVAVQSIADDGIYSILVQNRSTNVGYEKISGVIDTVNKLSATEVEITIRAINTDSETTLEFSTPDYYKDMTLYAQKGDTGVEIGADVFLIYSSALVSNNPTIRVTTSESSTITLEPGDIVDILPTVRITGNGAGAKAIPNVINGAIDKIFMISNGTGYTRAAAEIVSPIFSFSPDSIETKDVAATLKVIISPKNGHGSDIVRELRSKYIGISKNITSLNTNVPSEGTYAKIGLVKSPSFSLGFSDTSFDNRLAIRTVDDSSGVVIGSQITQGDVSGTIHAKETLDDNGTPAYFIYVTNYLGDYQGSFTTDTTISTTIGVFEINTINSSPYYESTGEVLYISDLTPVERTVSNFEQIKLVIEF